MKKIKFVDTICFRGEIDLLIFRITELYDYIDKFIIADFTESNPLGVLEKYEDKIIRILVSEQNYLDKIKTEFINTKPDFEDVLMISNTNEIPNLIDKNIFLDKLIFEPFILLHQNFVWNIDYIEKLDSRGTLVTNFSFILQLKKSMEKLYDLKVVVKLEDDKFLNNGWKLLNFGYNEKYDYQIKELLPPTEINPISTYGLIKHNNLISTNFEIR